jgi:hypothetical protein
MDLLTHREKLALLRHGLAEAQTKEERQEILRLLAKEEAQDGGVSIGNIEAHSLNRCSAKQR